jgi:cell division protein FtsL
MAEVKETAKKKKKTLSRHILGGDFLTEGFIMRQSKLMALIVCLIIVFISNRYYCMKKLTEIEMLNTQLHDVKHEHLIISMELTNHSRQTQIDEMLANKGIELRLSKAAVYEIQK